MDLDFRRGNKTVMKSLKKNDKHHKMFSMQTSSGVSHDKILL